MGWLNFIRVHNISFKPLSFFNTSPLFKSINFNILSFVPQNKKFSFQSHIPINSLCSAYIIFKISPVSKSQILIYPSKHEPIIFRIFFIYRIYY